jgi:hypothetical protein
MIVNICSSAKPTFIAAEPFENLQTLRGPQNIV